MKKYLLYSLLGATVLFTAACDEDFNEDVVPPQEWEQEEAIALPGLTATGTTEINLGEVEGDSISTFTATINGALPEGAFVQNYRIALTAQKEGATTTTFKTGANGNVAKQAIQDMIIADFGKLTELRKYDAVVYVDIINEDQASLIEGKTEFSAIPEQTIEIPKEMFMIGDFCDWNWDKAPAMVPVHGTDGVFWRLVYFPEGKGFKINSATAWNGNEIGFAGAIVKDNFEAGISDAGGNIGVAKGGWYNVIVKVTMDDEGLTYNVDINEPAVYLFGPTAGDVWEPKNETKFKVPATADEAFESIPFIKEVNGDPGIRACVSIPGVDWWRTEFMVFDGKLVYRGNGGDQERISGKPGQKLYINFTNGTGSIE